ncbi:ileal sodium/bile acid cotransporter-like isoform X3 [Homarus americanus]|uniref:ileal sodium/bile acid cotransporter-like isoform X3 n=1 Tax=Homarus americanus TaxID=6706 RepID=UPI001C44E91B|nr:ileal sodium/bile acid cotransporter-like isoform X3 [Homarus americanus]
MSKSRETREKGWWSQFGWDSSPSHILTISPPKPLPCLIGTMRWSLTVLAVMVTTGCTGLELLVYPSDVLRIPEDTLHNLTLSLTFNTTQAFDAALNRSGSVLVVRVVPDEEWKLKIVNTPVQFTAQEVTEAACKTVMVSGYYWGHTRLSFYLTVNHVDDQFLPGVLLRDDVVVLVLQVVVDRSAKLLDSFFIMGVTLFLICNTVNMGCQLDLKLIWQVLRKPVGPVCGFLSQFAFMPGVGEAPVTGCLHTTSLTISMFQDPLQRLGLFTLGCCPGGILSNFITLLFSGDLNLSVTMTFISTLSAMGMMPLWMYTLGTSLTSENNYMKVPFANLAISLVSLTVPTGIGMFIKYKRPRWAEISNRLIKPITVLILVLFGAIGAYSSYKAFLMMNGAMLLAGLIITVAGYAFGAIMSKLCCLKRDKIIAISIETAFQNAGVCFIVLKLSLPTPESDLAALPALAQIFLTAVPVMLSYGVYEIARHYCGCCPTHDTNQPTNLTPDSKDPTEFVETSISLLSGDKH